MLVTLCHLTFYVNLCSVCSSIWVVALAVHGQNKMDFLGRAKNFTSYLTLFYFRKIAEWWIEYSEILWGYTLSWRNMNFKVYITLFLPFLQTVSVVLSRWDNESFSVYIWIMCYSSVVGVAVSVWLNRELFLLVRLSKRAVHLKFRRLK